MAEVFQWLVSRDLSGLFMIFSYDSYIFLYIFFYVLLNFNFIQKRKKLLHQNYVVVAVTYRVKEHL
jgi:hypothetical protein